MVQLDRTNLLLVELLQRDARTSTSELARLVNRAESTVRERLLSLERGGILRGYRAVVDMERLGYPVHAMIRADGDLAHISDLAKQLDALPQVVSANFLTGPKPIRIEVRTESAARLEHVLERRIAPLALERIETGLIVQRLVEPRPVPLGGLVRGLPFSLVEGPAPARPPTEPRLPVRVGPADGDTPREGGATP